ncbi:hypothetical protein FB478_103477 [Arthrobacter sp. AG367]|nr:hypothetical protein FB478_103477 [Arthrobacter sp. AG367]
MKTMSQLSAIRSFRNSWPFLRAKIVAHLGENPCGEDIFRLGDHLSGIFLSVPAAIAAAQQRETSAISEQSSPQRTQSDVSAGGVVWECLVTWYLNFVCYGTDLLASKRTRANTPSVITDAISVTLHGYSTTTESDLIVFSVPGANASPSGILTISEINNRIKEDTAACSVAVVQCKTNWNDNAQIPMLWDLIYRSLPFVNVSSIQLGRNGVNPRCFHDSSIKYAFVTVPTNRNARYAVGSVPVTRVLGLSGGNYWGKPTEPGVATGFSDFLNNNFSAHFTGSVANHISRQITTEPALLRKFLELDFS